MEEYGGDVSGKRMRRKKRHENNGRELETWARSEGRWKCDRKEAVARMRSEAIRIWKGAM